MVDSKAPMFIRIDDYKNVLNVLNAARDKLNQAKDLLARISSIKNEEDAMLSEWNANLEEIEHRVDQMGEVMREPEA